MAKFLAVSGLALVLALATEGVVAEEFVVGVLERARISSELPDGWDLGTPEEVIPQTATARLTRGTEPDSLILITVLRPAPGTPLSQPGGDTIVQLVSQSAAEASDQSVEGELRVQQFESGAIQGAYFSATDKAPPPGEFKYMSQGVAAFGDFAISFTALSHVDGVVARDAMLKAVGSLRSTPAQ